jgi:hypothetical protein
VSPASDIDDQPGIRDLNVPGRALAVTSAENVSAANLFVKICRSVDVGDSDEVGDGEPVMRRHRVTLCFDL